MSQCQFFLCFVVFDYSTAKNRNTKIITVRYTIFTFLRFFFNNDTVDGTLYTFYKPALYYTFKALYYITSITFVEMTGWIGRETCLHYIKTFEGEKCMPSFFHVFFNNCSINSDTKTINIASKRLHTFTFVTSKYKVYLLARKNRYTS